MISSKKELKFYLMADRMMNRGEFKGSWKAKIKDFFFPDYVMRWLVAMRSMSYYKHGGVNCFISCICESISDFR